MGTVSHIETVVAPFLPYGVDITDLLFSPASGITVVAGTGASARYLTMDTGTTATITSSGFQGYLAGDFSDLNFASRTLKLSDWQLDSQRLAAQANFDSGTTLTHFNNGFAGDAVQVAWADLGGQQWLISSQPDSVGLVSFAWNGSDTFTAADVTSGLTETTYADISTATGFGQTWVVTTSTDNDVVAVHSLAGDGSLQFIAQSGAANGLWISDPVAHSVVDIGGQPYVLVASAQSNSLSVLRLDADGTLHPIDHVIDNLVTRFGGAMNVQTTSINGTIFAVVSGNDDGFSVFQLRPDGQLSYVASQQDQLLTTLNNIGALAFGSDANGTHIYASSSSEVGITHFAFDPGTLGQSLSGTPLADLISGTTANDTILGGSGDDDLRGKSGDDILADGNGSDTLTGGSGADTFILSYDGDLDRITDFQAGVDAIDLSYFPLLYDVKDLTFLSTVAGATFTFHGEVTEVLSSDGSSLTIAELFAIDPFDTTRPTAIYPNGTPIASAVTILGSSAADLLVGTPGDDYFSGEDGGDTMIGGAGADAFFGGNGFDVVDYSTAPSGIILDLENPNAATGVAFGDSFSSIEAINGTGFDDQISGSVAGDLLDGGGGDDTLFGRMGNDALQGGAGNDTLRGGPGGDVLDGGSGTDVADYLDAGTSIRLDLTNRWTGAGDAAGDRFVSVENVIGSANADTLLGTRTDNTIWGQGGGDWLIGRNGDDQLFGQGGNDTLSGGPGADHLDGGAGVDLADYSGAKSAITADLDDPSANTGQATGDRFVSIEGLSGSRFADTLLGNATANTLRGGAGNDTLSGRDGNDALNGGFGDDRLIGGDGDDTLTGGSGSDVFVFDDMSGQDQITDFDRSMDTVELHVSGLAATSAELVAKYASVTGGDIFLDFGAGHGITFDDFTDLDGLSDALVIV